MSESATGTKTDGLASGWTGLTLEELLDLVLEIAPPLHRSDRFKGSCPTEAASKVLSYVIEQVVEARILPHQPERRGPYSISKQLQDALKMSGAYVSQLKRGELQAGDGDPVTWKRLESAFRWLVLGASSASVVTDERLRWIERVSQYLFGKRAAPSAFFSRAALGNGSPRGLDEAIFNALWMADQALRHNTRCCITAASAAIPFIHVNNHGHLTDSGKALVLAAAAGVRLLLVFPANQTGDGSVARSSAERFVAASEEFVAAGEWPWESACVFHRLVGTTPGELRQRAMRNICLRGVSLNAPGATPGFLSPAFRFTSFRTYQGDLLSHRAFFLIRADGEDPPMYEFGSKEEQVFFDWCRQLHLPVDPTLALPERSTPGAAAPMPTVSVPQRRRSRARAVGKPQVHPRAAKRRAGHSPGA